MIGLTVHTVRVVEHDPAWAAIAGVVCDEIRNAGGPLLADVQHVGSTSVAGLPAKPILDVAAAAVSRDALPEIVRRMTGSGYLDRGDRGEEGGHLLVRESSPGVRTMHLHAVEHAGPQWRNYLFFRGLLRQNARMRAEYAALKRELGHRFRDDRESYTAAKAEFIRRKLELAKARPLE